MAETAEPIKRALISVSDKTGLVEFCKVLTSEFNIEIVSATTFDESLKKVRAEINRDNLKQAIQQLKKISVTTENEEEQIDLLFGDIYLKINQPQKAEEFYQKTLFTSNENIESRIIMDFLNSWFFANIVFCEKY